MHPIGPKASLNMILPTAQQPRPPNAHDPIADINPKGSLISAGHFQGPCGQQHGLGDLQAGGLAGLALPVAAPGVQLLVEVDCRCVRVAACDLGYYTVAQGLVEGWQVVPLAGVACAPGQQRV